MSNSNTIQLVLEVVDKGSAKIKAFSSTLTDQVSRMSTASIGRVQTLAASFQQHLGGAIDRVKNSVMNLKPLAMTALVGWGLERLASGFIETGASMDKMRMSLNTITKGDGDAWFQRLNEWSMRMPVNTEKAIQSFTMMRAMGLKPSITDMTTLVDTVSALGGQSDALEGIARALGQMQSKGHGTAQDLMQLAERGVPVFEILNEKLHLTGAQIQDIGNQSVTAQEIIKALFEGLAERFGGQSEKIQKVYVGLMESLKGYWVEFKRLVMSSGVMAFIEAGLQKINDYIDTLQKNGGLQEWAEDVASRVVAGVKKTTMAAAGAYDWFAEYLPKIGTFFSGLWDSFTSLPEWIRDAGLVGAFLYGKKGAVVLAGALHLIESVKNSAAGLGLVASGQLDFSKYATMNQSELAKYIKKFNEENPVVLDASARINVPEMSGGAAEAVKQFWSEFDNQITDTAAKAKIASQSIVRDAEDYGLTTARITSETLRRQAAGAIEIAEADKKALEERLADAQKFYDSLQSMIQKNAEEEKRLIGELNALYKQKEDIQKSAAAQIRSLQEIGMTSAQKYESQKSAISDQYLAAMQLSGQEQIKALDEYRQALTSFGQTWSAGVTETSQNMLFGEQTSVIVSGKEIIASVISDIETAVNLQKSAMEGLTAEKQKELQVSKAWGDTLVETAQEWAAEIDKLKGVISELSAQIEAMQKTITITGDDQVSWVVDNIARSLDALHDKTVYITTVYQSVGGISGASSGSSSDISGLDLDAGWSPTPYALGTGYVPKTGMYLLHKGEEVKPQTQTTSRAALSIGELNIRVPESAAPQRPEDWREITRNYIVPELQKVFHA